MQNEQSTLDRVDAGLRRAASRLAGLGVALLLVQAFAIVLDALTRWLFSTPIHGMEDVNGLLIAVTVVSFLPALFMERGNVTITLLGRALGPRAARFLDAFGQVLAFVFIALVAWQYGDYAANLNDWHTVIIELPKAPAAWAATLLLCLTAALQAFVALHSLIGAFAPDALLAEDGGR